MIQKAVKAERFFVRLSSSIPMSTFGFVTLAIAMIWSTGEFSTAGGILQHHGTFLAWLYLVMTAPVLVSMSWLMLNHMSGIASYWGYWIRFSADTSMMFAVVAFDVTRFTDHASNMVARALIVISLLALAIRDIYRIFHLEITVAELARAEREQDAG